MHFYSVINVCKKGPLTCYSNLSWQDTIFPYTPNALQALRAILCGLIHLAHMQQRILQKSLSSLLIWLVCRCWISLQCGARLLEPELWTSALTRTDDDTLRILSTWTWNNKTLLAPSITLSAVDTCAANAEICEDIMPAHEETVMVFMSCGWNTKSLFVNVSCKIAFLMLQFINENT